MFERLWRTVPQKHGARARRATARLDFIAQHSFGELPLGNVGVHPNDANGATVVVIHHIPSTQDPPLRAIRPFDAELALSYGAMCSDGVCCSGGNTGVFFARQCRGIWIAVGHRRGAPKSEQLSRTRGEPHDLRFEVEAPRAHFRRAEDGVQPFLITPRVMLGARTFADHSGQGHDGHVDADEKKLKREDVVSIGPGDEESTLFQRPHDRENVQREQTYARPSGAKSHGGPEQARKGDAKEEWGGERGRRTPLEGERAEKNHRGGEARGLDPAA